MSVKFTDPYEIIDFIFRNVNKLLFNLKKDIINEKQKDIIIKTLYILYNNFEYPCDDNLSKYDIYGILYNTYKDIIDVYNEIMTESSITENHCILLLGLLYYLMYIITPLKHCGKHKFCNNGKTFTFDVNTSFRFDLILSNTLKILTKDELNKINDKSYVITLIMFILYNINKRITDLDKYRSDYKQFYYDNIGLYYYIFDSLMRLIGRNNCYCYPGWKNLIDYFNNNVFNFNLLIYINSNPTIKPVISNLIRSEIPPEAEYVRARGCIVTDRRTHIYITDTVGTYSDEISPIGSDKASEYDTIEKEAEEKAEEKKTEEKKAEETEEPKEGHAAKKPRKDEPPITGGLNAYYKYLTYKYEKYFK